MHASEQAPSADPVLAPAIPASPRRRPLAVELVFVILVCLAVNVPGIWSYSLVDPWETHYGEVSRRMLQDHDLVHTDWQAEGFRSKPVLSFWMMAASMRAVGLAKDGGYSGELEHDARTMFAIRIPFVLFATMGLALLWWMLARLVNRRLAWLALLVVGSTPFICLVARQAMPDMPLVATTIGALALFIMAVEDGDRPIDRVGRIGGVVLDARHLFYLVIGGLLAIEALYYLVYFIQSPVLASHIRVPNPAIFLPLFMVLLFGATSRDGWLLLRTLVPFVLIGGAISAALGERARPPSPGQSMWRHVFDDYLTLWERHAPDRYVVRGLLMIGVWGTGGRWADTQPLAERVIGMTPIRSMRQVYLLWCYALLGVGILAKGPPGLGVVGLVGVLHVVLLGRWRALADGFYEVKRGLLVMIVVFLPWHVAMWLKDGLRFIDEYLFTHILNRAAVGVDNSPGTFEMYTSQIGHGMWLWAGLLPAAFAAACLRSRLDTRAGRVRFHIALWAIAGGVFFSIVQTKFHHYILPVVPALGILVAFLLDDVLAGRDRLHPLWALLAAGITLLLCRDLTSEPERWIEMFVYRYDRPWPNADPYNIDVSDGFLGLGIAGALALLLLATRFRRLAVAAVGAVGLAICVWALQCYMPVAGKHWGMREAIHAYYAQRTVYGQKLVYFGPGALWDDWHDATDQRTFETFVPDALQVGQPMTITVQLDKAEDERITETTVVLLGSATAIGDHAVTVTLAPGERDKLGPLLARGAEPNAARGRPPVRVVDADRLISWQLYWRGEAFWSGDEIWGWLPEMKTSDEINTKNDNVAFLKYINDRTRAPLGRRYFLITEAGRAVGTKSMIPTQRGKDSFEVIDQTSNKFWIVAFTL